MSQAPLPAGGPAVLQHAVRVVAAPTGPNPTISHVVLRVDPPGIGTIAVRLVNHGGEVTVAIRADSTDAANAVAATRAELGQALNGHGLNLADIRVSTGGADTSGSGQPGSGWTTAGDSSAGQPPADGRRSWTPDGMSAGAWQGHSDEDSNENGRAS